MGIDFRGILRRLQQRLELLGRGYITLTAKQKELAIEFIDRETAKSKSEFEKIFMEAVGRSLSFWAKVEELLVVITGILLGTQSTKAGIIMYSIVNFNVRLNIINELFSIDHDYRRLEPKWNKINEKLRSLRDTRDRLAHHTIYPAEETVSMKIGTSLKPARFDVRQKSQKYQPLDFKKIMQFSSDLRIVTKDLLVLINAMELVQRDTLQRKSSEQDSGQPSP